MSQKNTSAQREIQTTEKGMGKIYFKQFGREKLKLPQNSPIYSDQQP